ncbi:RNA polymerase sigma factor [Anaerostipes caccae]|uniref:RNA polymerase sigma factor n=3 Tax=Bacillota TaxID=1239 RepID=A0A6N2V5E7_9FIRM
MEPNSREFYKQCAFQKFCNTVLHNEACDTHRELRRHKAKEVTFSDMTLDEARQLHTFDEYFKREAAETVFEKAGKKITPKLLLEAIRTLPEEKRKAILLYYFEGMNDTEIAELFNTSRSTIQYRRTSSFEKLRKYLEENALVPYPVIVAATKGDPDAMKIVLQHFSGYIARLSMRKLYDERGNVYFGVDHDIRERLQAKLMMAVLTFKAEE